MITFQVKLLIKKLYLMKHLYCIRLFRVNIIFLTICILFIWLIPSILSNFNKQMINEIISYDNIFDNHIYPPPWYISNWTMNDYFIRKDQIKIDNEGKIFIEGDFLNKKQKNKSNYLILEYTKVLNQPKFCGKSDEIIFGKKCPYKNCK